MATLSQNIDKTIHDFDSIRDAIRQQGVEVPDGTDTSEYAEKILDIQSGGSENLDEFISGNLATVTSNVEIVPDFAFSAKSNLEEVNLPEATYIGKYAFSSVAGAISGSGSSSDSGSGEGSEMLFNNKKLKTVNMPKVTNIDVSAFDSDENLEITSLPDTLVVIQDKAFRNCNKVQLTSLPEHLTYIGDEALVIQENLDLSQLPQTLTYIGSGITSEQLHSYFEQFVVGGVLDISQIPRFWLEVELGNNIGGNGRFAGFTLGTTLNVPDGIKSIPNRLFYGAMTGVETINIPDSVISIGSYAFTQSDRPWESTAGCPASQINIGQNVKTIGDNAFWGITHVTELVIPDSVTDIGMNAFYGNSSQLSSLTLGTGLQNIDYSAFSQHPNITELVIPDNVISIGNYAFNCSNGDSQLQSLTIGAGITELSSYAFSYHRHVSELNVHFDNITVYDDHCLYQIGKNSELQFSIPITSDVTYVGDQAFAESAVQHVLWDAQLDYSDVPAFQNCSKLESFTIGDHVESVNVGQLLWNCSPTSIIVGKNLSSWIDTDGTLYKTNLTSITVDAENTTFDSRDNCNAIIRTETNSIVVGCSNTVIPDTVTAIESYAFRYASFTSLVIPEHIITINSWAFANCESLHTLILPTSLQYLGAGAFANSAYPYIKVLVKNPNMQFDTSYVRPFNSHDTIYANDNSTAHAFATSIGAPFVPLEIDDITWTIDDGSLIISGTGAIPDYQGDPYMINAPWSAFYSVIQSVEIGNSITAIGTWTFAESYITSAIIGSEVDNIRYGAFTRCPNLASIHIPATVHQMDTNPFRYCPNLSSITVDPENHIYDSRNDCNAIINTSSNSLLVGCSSTTIPVNTVVTISQHAFEGTYSASNLQIPEGVASIANFAFYNCDNLTSVKLPNSLQGLSEGVFQSTSTDFGLTRLDLTDVTTVIGIPGYNSMGYAITMQENGVIAFSDATVMSNYQSSQIWDDLQQFFVLE